MNCAAASDAETIIAAAVGFACIFAAMAILYRRASRALDRWELRQAVEHERPIS